jgi:hypothetical protein
MGLLKEATNEQAYLKAGILGFAGTGKTFTASKLAIGLHHYIKSEKPVAFADTETGKNFIRPLFEEANVRLFTSRTRAFVDLLAITREAEKTCEILIVDSITHFYNELVKSYKVKLKRDRLRVWDWAPIKDEWAQFTELFLNSSLHIIMLGRAGWEYEEKEDDDGVTQISKSGTKMKVETDFGYEPSLTIEMQRVREGNGKIGQEFTYRAWVIKDRFNKINGRSFDFDEDTAKDITNPVFKAFLPHIELLNIGGIHAGVDTEVKSGVLFSGPDSKINIHKRRDIALENIENEIVKRVPGRTDKDKQEKIRLLEFFFGTNSWTAISDMHPDKLEAGLKALTTIESEVVQ